MRGDELEVGIAVEEAVEDHPGHGERRVEHEADRPAQVELAHVHEVGAGRLARMHQDGQGAPVDLGPDRCERGLGQAPPGDVGDDHDADRALVAASGQLLDGASGILPGQRGEPADPVRMGVCASAIASFDSRAARVLTSSPPQYTFGQVSDTIETSMPAASICSIRRSVVEVAGLREHDRRLAAKDLLATVRAA